MPIKMSVLNITVKEKRTILLSCTAIG